MIWAAPHTTCNSDLFSATNGYREIRLAARSSQDAGSSEINTLTAPVPTKDVV